MATTARTNVNASGQMLQTWLDRKVLENFEPNLYFHKMWKQPVLPSGYNTLAFTKASKLTVSDSSAELTEWQTPTEEAFTYTTINVTPKQYGLYVTISDMLKDASAVNVIGDAATEVGSNMARLIDSAIQGVVVAGTNVTYAATTSWGTRAADRASLGATNIMFGIDLATISTKLEARNAPKFWPGYAAVIHPNVYHSLKTDTATGWFIDTRKYAQPDAIFKWEVGMLWWIRLIVSSNVKTLSSTVTVYPTFVFGAGSYWVASLQSLKSYVTGWTATDSDPLAQRVKVGAKVAFNSIILQEDAMERFESASGI